MFSNFTRTERDIFETLLNADGAMVSIEEILRNAWPNESDPDPIWIKPHVARIRTKVAYLNVGIKAGYGGRGYKLEMQANAKHAAKVANDAETRKVAKVRCVYCYGSIVNPLDKVAEYHWACRKDAMTERESTGRCECHYCEEMREQN